MPEISAEQAVKYAYIFQRKTPDFLARLPVNPQEFEAVAHVLKLVNTVSGDARELFKFAFSATQNVEDHWSKAMTLGNGTAYGSNFRSTSCGDVLVVDNQVWQITSEGWKEVDASAVEFVYLIPDPAVMLQAAVHALSARYGVTLSFGYIGNIWSDGPPEERDDRSWYVFTTIGRRWGGCPTKGLGELAAKAREVLKDNQGKSTLEKWVASLAPQTLEARLANQKPTLKP